VIERLGVVGAGTMGSGIAGLGAAAGLDTLLYDPDAEALSSSLESTGEGVRGAGDLAAMADRQLVIEAAPENLDLKREVFAQLAEACTPKAVLATNTSSLSITAIAAGVPEPGRVVGMHFFNPPAKLKLVEIVAGDESSEEALAAATAVGEAMGRTPIRAKDGIGFVANRCARPFTLESLRMLGEGVATHEEIDRICRLAGGFRMGPFELMDLIGIDVNFAVARSFYEQSFGEPRWRPHPIQARMVASGRLGRKAGRGFYDYPSEGRHRPEDPKIKAARPISDEALLNEIAGPPGTAVMNRIGAQIVNEAAFALGDGVASPGDIDTAMRLGFNWPIGPLQWADRLGSARAVGILDELRETGGDAYRAAPLLREAVASGTSLGSGS
jgi:3-hydroxybutyryl-CoA dehydrogenase